ncbi:hypothetical protein [Bacteroides sp.]|uniref:hypothetical protein n=1 Tax=Bacteroides sp. TaxID=29523 RepID=UPI002620AAE8|nr:hypothetical protein [Bacteroides sp.]MDD3040199.1 hypothetical protein [Bacteroides sp.]
MKVKVDSKDVLEIAKALKCGWLDMGKIESFKSLLDCYNPHKEIKRDELNYYLDCLYKGWGYKPTDEGSIKEMMLQGLDGELLEKWRKHIESNSVYKRMVKEAFLGMVAIKALGGTFADIEPDFSFTGEEPPDFK